MGLLTAGFAQKLRIQFFHLRILMRFPDGFCRVVFIKRTGPDGPDIMEVSHVSPNMWLPAAVNTAARTAHYFDELIIRLAGAHFLLEFSGVAKA